MTSNDVPQESGRSEKTISLTPSVSLERMLQLLEVLPDAVVVVDTSGHIALVNQQAEALFGYSRIDLLGQPIERLIPQWSRRVHRRHRDRYAATPITRPMGTTLRLAARRHDGREFPVEVSLSPLPVSGTSDEFVVLATMRNISARLQTERAQREAEAATDELLKVQAITDAGLSHQTLDALLPAVLSRLYAVLRVDNAAILLLDRDEQVLTVRAVHGLEEAVAADVRVPVGQGFAGQIAASRAPLVIDDLHTFPVITPLLREQLCSVLGVPLLVEDRLLGVLHVGTATPYHFTERETRLLELVAERIALAIDRARLYDAEQAAIAQARQQEARAARLVTANVVGVMVAEGGRLIEANDAFLQMVGYTRADLAAGHLRWPEMTPPEYAPLHVRALAELAERGTCTPFETEYVRQDGSRVPVLIGVARLEEHPERHASFVVDLSEQRRLQDTVAKTAAQLEATFQAMGDGIVVFDMTGQVVLVNAAEVRITGYPSAESMRQDLAYFAEVFELFEMDGRPLPVEEWPVSRVLRGEAVADWKLRGRRRDTGQAWVFSYSGEPVRDVAGQQVLAVVVTRDITERERLARAVAERAQQLEAIMGAMVDGVVVYDAAGRITQMNTAAQAMFVPDSVLAYAALPLGERTRLFQPRDLAGQPLGAEAAPQARVLRGETVGGVAATDDVVLRDIHGDDRIISVTGAPLRDAARAVKGAVLAFRDVTEHRRLDQKARALAAQLQATFDAITDAVLVYDVAGHILHLNPAARMLIGLADEATEAAFLTLSIAERWARSAFRSMDGQPLPLAAFPVARLLRGEVLTPSQHQDVRMMSPDGYERVLSFTGGPMRDTVGKLLGYVSVGRDITARWQLEQQVRFQSSLLERTHDAIFVWELGGPLVFWNQGAELLLGYRADEALGQVTQTLLHTRLPEPAPEFEARLERAGEWVGELIHSTRDGHAVDVLCRLQVLRAEGLPGSGPQGDATSRLSRARRYVCETAHDITERKVLEHEREEALAREVTVREVNRQLDEFFTIAAHDIRNPVSVVKANVQLAKRRFEKVLAAVASPAPTAGPATGSSTAHGEAASTAPRAGGDSTGELAERFAAVHDSLEAAQASTDRLTRLTAQLFDVARARTGTLELNLAPCDLVTLVREQVTAQRLTTSERTIYLELPAGGATVLVQADADRLSQVLANYLTNALKYSAEDQPVTVGMEVTAGLAVVWVRDHGPGLPWVEQSQVWELLHRAPGVHVQSRLGEETGSLGLGLHICKRIVELHPGGRVGVESEVGAGATFWFRLPLLAEKRTELHDE
jgi:PAS domain S-box-containing protein